MSLPGKCKEEEGHGRWRKKFHNGYTKFVVFFKKGTIATSYEGQPLKKFHLFPGIAAKILWQRSFVFVFYVSSLQLNFVV